MPKKTDKPTNVRFIFPPDVRKKVKSHQRKLSANKDHDVTFEEATVDFIRVAKISRA